MSLTDQFYAFFIMLLCGLILGISFDIYRVSARPLFRQRWILFIMDILYWVVSTFLIFRMLYVSNDGEIRLFVFLGVLLGAWGYFRYISSYIITIVESAIKMLRRLMIFGYQCIEIIILRPIRMSYRFFVILIGIITAMTMFLFKIVVQLLYPFHFLASWIRKKVKQWYH